MMDAPESVLDFWFVEHGRDDWFGGKPEFDRRIAERFAGTHAAVARGEAWTWRTTPVGRLAEILVLDQFSRQLYRGSSAAFASDDMALALGQEAVAGGHDLELDAERRLFIYMPYMHSESLIIHEEAIRLFTALGDPQTLEFEQLHAECLRRFGRYPRRNAALGRESTAEEIAYLESGTGMF
jgi:uncharacterized protein (DUF924 family)